MSTFTHKKLGQSVFRVAYHDVPDPEPSRKEPQKACHIFLDLGLVLLCGLLFRACFCLPEFLDLSQQ
jgi:hypothetical protein